MRPAALAAMGAAFLAAACEHGVTVHGTVTVPVEVQRLFSAERPGLVRISASVPKTSFLDYQLAVLCEPGSAALALDFFHDGFGCAKQGVVRADVLPAADGQSLVCGAGQTLGGATAGGPVVATGSATVFEGATGDLGCSSGTDSIDIVLALVR